MVYISKIKNEINKKISWNLPVITFTKCLIWVHQFAVFLKQWIYFLFSPEGGEAGNDSEEAIGGVL